MTFAEWLQGRLNAHGFSVRVEGDIGGEVKAALIAFQRSKKLRQSGVADEATVGALRMEPGSKVAVEVPEERMPPWMAEMYRRMGLHEKTHNKTLSDWLKGGKWLGNPAKLPWCGDAVETCFAKTLPFEPLPSNPFWAQAWAKFGVDAGGPDVGAVGVIKWSASAGHVGFVADSTASKICMLGGNQSDRISLAWFPRSKFIAFRWASSYPKKSYPPLKGGKDGDMAGTR